MKLEKQKDGRYSIRNCPVFVPTEKTSLNQKGEKIQRRYTPEVLQQIVRNWQQRASTSDWKPPVTVYHLSDSSNESLSSSDINKKIDPKEAQDFQSGNKVTLSGTGDCINPSIKNINYDYPDSFGGLERKEVPCIHCDLINLGGNIVNRMLSSNLKSRSPDIRWLDDVTPEFRCLSLLPDGEIPHSKLPLTDAKNLNILDDSFGDIQLVEIQTFAEPWEDNPDDWKKEHPETQVADPRGTPLEEMIREEGEEREEIGSGVEEAEVAQGIKRAGFKARGLSDEEIDWANDMAFNIEMLKKGDELEFAGEGSQAFYILEHLFDEWRDAPEYRGYYDVESEWIGTKEEQRDSEVMMNKIVEEDLGFMPWLEEMEVAQEAIYASKKGKPKFANWLQEQHGQVDVPQKRRADIRDALNTMEGIKKQMPEPEEELPTSRIEAREALKKDYAEREFKKEEQEIPDPLPMRKGQEKYPTQEKKFKEKEEGKEKIFVFGSNLAGRHGKGAAEYAKINYGAKYGQGEGFQGKSYAIPTKDKNLKTLPLSEIQKSVNKFLEFAKEKPEYEFELTPIGTGLAGYKPEDIAPMFETISDNIVMPKKFEGIVKPEIIETTKGYGRTEKEIHRPTYIETEPRVGSKEVRHPSAKIESSVAEKEAPGTVETVKPKSVQEKVSKAEHRIEDRGPSYERKPEVEGSEYQPPKLPGGKEENFEEGLYVPETFEDMNFADQFASVLQKFSAPVKLPIHLASDEFIDLFVDAIEAFSDDSEGDGFDDDVNDFEDGVDSFSWVEFTEDILADYFDDSFDGPDEQKWLNEQRGKEKQESDIEHTEVTPKISTDPRHQYARKAVADAKEEQAGLPKESYEMGHEYGEKQTPAERQKEVEKRAGFEKEFKGAMKKEPVVPKEKQISPDKIIGQRVARRRREKSLSLRAKDFLEGPRGKYFDKDKEGNLTTPSGKVLKKGTYKFVPIIKKSGAYGTYGKRLEKQPSEYKLYVKKRKMKPEVPEIVADTPPEVVPKTEDLYTGKTTEASLKEQIPPKEVVKMMEKEFAKRGLEKEFAGAREDYLEKVKKGEAKDAAEFLKSELIKAGKGSAKDSIVDKGLKEEPKTELEKEVEQVRMAEAMQKEKGLRAKVEKEEVEGVDIPGKEKTQKSKKTQGAAEKQKVKIDAKESEKEKSGERKSWDRPISTRTETIAENKKIVEEIKSQLTDEEISEVMKKFQPEKDVGMITEEEGISAKVKKPISESKRVKGEVLEDYTGKIRRAFEKFLKDKKYSQAKEEYDKTELPKIEKKKTEGKKKKKSKKTKKSIAHWGPGMPSSKAHKERIAKGESLSDSFSDEFINSFNDTVLMFSSVAKKISKQKQKRQKKKSKMKTKIEKLLKP